MTVSGSAFMLFRFALLYAVRSILGDYQDEYAKLTITSNTSVPKENVRTSAAYLVCFFLSGTLNIHQMHDFKSEKSADRNPIRVWEISANIRSAEPKK